LNLCVDGAGIAIKGDAWMSGWYPTATEKEGLHVKNDLLLRLLLLHLLRRRRHLLLPSPSPSPSPPPYS